MWRNNQYLSKINSLLFPFIFFILVTALAINVIQIKFDIYPFAAPTQKIPNFTYEIESGERGTANFPHSFDNLAPQTAVTIYVHIEPGCYDSLLLKTVYTSLRLYSDDELIYECGETGSYPPWLLTPPTLMKLVPLPNNASNLRFEYISPSLRPTMSLPVLWAGSKEMLLAMVFKENAVLLVMSLLFIILGLVLSFTSLFFWNKGKVFLYLGLSAFATGCWSFGECDATAFLVPYPFLLYLMAFGGLFTLIIPLLHYGCIILNPRNGTAIKLARAVSKVAAVTALILQLTGVAAFSKTMYVFHILIPLCFVIFMATVVWEYYYFHNKMAKRLAMPTIVLAVSAILEVVNYHLHITSSLSLFFISGAFLFTLMLGFIGGQFALERQKEIEELAAKTDFYLKANHALRTPLTVISTNIQTAKRRPEEVHELLTDSQAEIMKMAEMIDDILNNSDKKDDVY